MSLLYTDAQRNRGDEPAALSTCTRRRRRRRSRSCSRLSRRRSPRQLSSPTRRSPRSSTATRVRLPPIGPRRRARARRRARCGRRRSAAAAPSCSPPCSPPRAGSALWGGAAAPTGSAADPAARRRRRRRRAGGVRRRTRSRSRRRARSTRGAQAQAGSSATETRRRNARSRARSSRRDVSAIAAGARHSAATTVRGQCFCWGDGGGGRSELPDDSWGALRASDGDGDGDGGGAPADGWLPPPSAAPVVACAPQPPRWAPVALPPPPLPPGADGGRDRGWRTPACGERHTGPSYASTSSGAALVALCTWGRGDGGRLGHGTPCVDVVTPKLVAALAGERCVSSPWAPRTVALCEGAERARPRLGLRTAAGGVGGGGVPALDCAVPRPLPLPRAPLHVVVAGGRPRRVPRADRRRRRPPRRCVPRRRRSGARARARAFAGRRRARAGGAAEQGGSAHATTPCAPSGCGSGRCGCSLKSGRRSGASPSATPAPARCRRVAAQPPLVPRSPTAAPPCSLPPSTTRRTPPPLTARAASSAAGAAAAVAAWSRPRSARAASRRRTGRPRPAPSSARRSGGSTRSRRPSRRRPAATCLAAPPVRHGSARLTLRLAAPRRTARPGCAAAMPVPRRAALDAAASPRAAVDAAGADESGGGGRRGSLPLGSGASRTSTFGQSRRSAAPRPGCTRPPAAAAARGAASCGRSRRPPSRRRRTRSALGRPIPRRRPPQGHGGERPTSAHRRLPRPAAEAADARARRLRWREDAGRRSDLRSRARTRGGCGADRSARR